ncbi:hypothetical protein JCM10212_005766 [Sporobolomyces blumeae]
MAPTKKSTKGKQKKSDLNENGRPPKIKRVKEVVFDPEQRKDYLTGFSKRKKAKQSERRNRAIEREREELRKMRAQIREQRKEQAAHNVRVAAEMYGDAGAEDGSDDEGFGSDGSDGSGDDGDDAAAPTTYETNEALTTVEVEPLSLSRSPSPVPLELDDEAFSAARSSATTTTTTKGPSQPASMHKKRVKNVAQARPKLSREEKKERAKGGKGKKKKLEGRMKGTKGKAAK